MTSTPRGKRPLCHSTPFPNRLSSLDINDISPINIHKFADLKERNEKNSVNGEGRSISLLKQIQSLPAVQTGKNNSRKSISDYQEHSSVLNLDIVESSDDEYQPPKKAKKSTVNGKKSEVKSKKQRKGSPVRPVLPKRRKVAKGVRNPINNKQLKTKSDTILSDIIELNETEEKKESSGLSLEKPSSKGKRNTNLIAKRSRAAKNRSKEEDISPKISEDPEVCQMVNGGNKSSDSVKDENSRCSVTVIKNDSVEILVAVGNVDSEKLKERLDDEVKERNENVNNSNNVDNKKSVIRRNKPRAARNKVDHMGIVGDAHVNKKPIGNIDDVLIDKPLTENTNVNKKPNPRTKKVSSDEPASESNKDDLKSGAGVQSNEVSFRLGNKESDVIDVEGECTVINENIKRNIKSVCRREIIKVGSNKIENLVTSIEDREVDCAKDNVQMDNENDKIVLQETPTSIFKKPTGKPAKSSVKGQSEVNDETTSLRSSNSSKLKEKKSPIPLLNAESSGKLLTRNSERLQNSSKDGECSKDVENNQKSISVDSVKEVENSSSTRVNKVSEAMNSMASSTNELQQDSSKRNARANAINSDDRNSWPCCNCRCHEKKQDKKQLFGKFKEKPFATRRMYGNGVEVCKLLKHEKNIMAGYVKIHRNSSMSGKTTNNTVYFVKEGKVEVKMPRVVESCQVGDVFMVLQDTEYEIRNISNDTVELSFVKYSRTT